MKVIILGCGYLGYNLSEELKPYVDDLLCIGMHSPYSAMMYKHYQNIDVFDNEQLNKIDFTDAVVLDCLANIDNHAKDNDEESLICELEEKYRTLLNKLREKKALKYVFISSGALYGCTEEPATEMDSVSPVNFYGRSKLRLEKCIQEGPLDFLILRLASPYGGFRMTDNRQGVIPILIESAFNNTPFEMLKSENTIRDYLHITDFAKAVNLLIENEVSNEILNVGSGTGYSLKSIIEIVERTTGEAIELYHVDCEVDLVDCVNLCIDKLRNRTGFECEVTITAGIYREVIRIYNDKKRTKEK